MTAVLAEQEVGLPPGSGKSYLERTVPCWHECVAVNWFPIPPQSIVGGTHHGRLLVDRDGNGAAFDVGAKCGGAIEQKVRVDLLPRFQLEVQHPLVPQFAR